MSTPTPYEAAADDVRLAEAFEKEARAEEDTAWEKYMAASAQAQADFEAWRVLRARVRERTDATLAAYAAAHAAAGAQSTEAECSGPDGRHFMSTSGRECLWCGFAEVAH